MATYKLIDRLRIQRILLHDLLEIWTSCPDYTTLRLCIILLVELLYTHFYEVNGNSAKSGQRIVSVRILSRYNPIARQAIITRNLICHAYGTVDFDRHIDWCKCHWSEITDLFNYVRRLIDAENILRMYYEVYHIPLAQEEMELNRLCNLYNTTDTEVIASRLQEDFL